jgi:peroxiredoxin
MKKLFLSFSLIALFSAISFAQAAPAPPALTLKVGDIAPDFTLPDTAGNKVKLSDFRNKKNVVLAFFVLAFTGG